MRFKDVKEILGKLRSFGFADLFLYQLLLNRFCRDSQENIDKREFL